MTAGLLIGIGILVELIVLTIGAFLFLKRLDKRNPPQISIKQSNVTSEMIRDGVKDALREIKAENELEKTLEKKRRAPDHIYSTLTREEKPIKSDGDLIPIDLPEEDKEILRMFYED